MNDQHNRHFSRRAVLKGAALLAAVTATTGTTAALAQAKASKAAMQYRNTPNGKQECSSCVQFIPGKTPQAEGTCKVVDGAISPHGWCIAYAPKG
ncbi:MAG: high-potential iron-sulfur protein [Bacteroidota bacterium]